MAKTQTKIGTMALTGKTGSVELPEEVTLYCPICETPVADKGQCLAKFIKVYSRISTTGFTVCIATNCPNCGTQDLPPAIKA